ncbi:hypothetical protein LINPERPRIM_LOCUS21190, partial [Linum perenne]
SHSSCSPPSLLPPPWYRTADCGVLRHYHRWIGSFVPVVLLSPEASYELPAIGGFHRRDFLCCGIDVCIHKR